MINWQDLASLIIVACHRSFSLDALQAGRMQCTQAGWHGKKNTGFVTSARYHLGLAGHSHCTFHPLEPTIVFIVPILCVSLLHMCSFQDTFVHWSTPTSICYIWQKRSSKRQAHMPLPQPTTQFEDWKWDIRANEFDHRQRKPLYCVSLEIKAEGSPLKM